MNNADLRFALLFAAALGIAIVVGFDPAKALDAAANLRGQIDLAGSDGTQLHAPVSPSKGSMSIHMTIDEKVGKKKPENVPR